MQEEDSSSLIGKMLRVRWDNTEQDFFYTIKEIIENTESILIFRDKHNIIKGINKKYIKEIT